MGESESNQVTTCANNDRDGTLLSLSDRDIDELISFFQLLDEWDREAGDQDHQVVDGLKPNAES